MDEIKLIMDNSDKISELKPIIKSFGKTMADLSRDSGVSYSSLNHYVNGYMRPGKQALQKIFLTLEEWEAQHRLLEGLKKLNIK